VLDKRLRSGRVICVLWPPLAAFIVGRPNAHAHILGVAAYSLALAGSFDETRAHAIALRKVMPRYTCDDFIAAFRFDPHGEALFRKGARLIGMA